MGFDWMAFAEGFMTESAAIIKEKKAEARTYGLEQDELAKRNLLKISERNATVNKVMGLTQMLSDNGVSNDQIQAAIASGPNAISELAVKVKEAVDAQNGTPLTSADVESIIRMPENFSPVNMELDEYVRRSYGLYSPNKGVSETPEIGFWDRVTGDAAMIRAKGKLDSSAIYEGYTAADINEMSALTDYEAVIPSTFATFADFKRFDNNARMSVEKDIVTKIKVLEESDPTYFAARTTLTDISPTSPIEDEIRERNAALKIVKDKHAQNFGSIFDQAITTYGTKAIVGLEDLMRTHMGDDYYNSLSSDVSTAIIEQGNASLDDDIEMKGSKVVKSGDTVTISNEAVFSDEDGALAVTFKLADDGTVISAESGGAKFGQEDAQSIYNDFESYVPGSTEEGTEPTRFDLDSTEGGDILSGRSLENVEAEVKTTQEKTYYVVDGKTIYGVPPRPNAIMSRLQGYSLDAETRDKIKNGEMAIPTGRNPLRVDEWDELFGATHDPETGELLSAVPKPKSQDQEPNFEGPIDSALPPSGFGSAAIGSAQEEESEDEEPSSLMSKRPKPRPKLSLRQKTMERFGVTQEDIEEGMDTGSITELDLQLLNESGDDIFEYIVENAGSEPLDDMQLYYQLSRWADENNKVLPFNMNFLIFMMKKGLAE